MFGILEISGMTGALWGSCVPVLLWLLSFHQWQKQKDKMRKQMKAPGGVWGIGWELTERNQKVNRTVPRSRETFAQHSWSWAGLVWIKCGERLRSVTPHHCSEKVERGSSSPIGKGVIKIYSSLSHVQMSFRSSDCNSIIQKNEIVGLAEIYIHSHTHAHTHKHLLFRHVLFFLERKLLLCLQS